jgi:hypothetical protein
MVPDNHIHRTIIEKKHSELSFTEMIHVLIVYKTIKIENDNPSDRMRVKNLIQRYDDQNLKDLESLN